VVSRCSTEWGLEGDNIYKVFIGHEVQAGHGSAPSILHTNYGGVHLAGGSIEASGDLTFHLTGATLTAGGNILCENGMLK